MANKDELIIKPKHPKGEDGYKTFSVRLKDDTVKRLDELAVQSGRSRNELIGQLLEYGLNRSRVEENL